MEEERRLFFFFLTKANGNHSNYYSRDKKGFSKLLHCTSIFGGNIILMLFLKKFDEGIDSKIKSICIKWHLFALP